MNVRPCHLITLAATAGIALVACRDQDPTAHVPVPGHPGAVKTAAVVRAERRAYDGAPPVIPHPRFGSPCIECHNTTGMSVPDLGFAPPMPHELTDGLSAMSQCTQCHVFAVTDERFVENAFEGLRQALRSGNRLNALSPPVLPHPVFMRENCTACHTGPAAREEIRCTHPERAHCLQCHVPVTAAEVFARRPISVH